MGLSIKNPKLESDIRELARVRGVGITEALQNAVSEDLKRNRRFSDEEVERRLAEVARIQDEVRRKRGNDTRTSTELLAELYDEHGLPR